MPNLPKLECKLKKSFTLIELLVVIAVLGVLSAGILVAINPGKRTAQARDAKRRNDINAIANALISYYTLLGVYPRERICDTSRGSYISGPQDDYNCTNTASPDFTVSTEWLTNDPAHVVIYDKLVNEQGFLKKLPTDPINNLTYYFRYEPKAAADDTCNPGGTDDCTHYWIGARLEAPNNPNDVGKLVFRCTDMPVNTNYNGGLGYAPGCTEVLFDNPGWIYTQSSFDNSKPSKGLP